jgi:hypothetical protein
VLADRDDRTTFVNLHIFEHDDSLKKASEIVSPGRSRLVLRQTAIEN